MQAACARGDYVKALAIQDRLMPLHLTLFTEPSPAGAKYAVSKLGLCTPECRVPVVPLSEGAKASIDAAMESLELSS